MRKRRRILAALACLVLWLSTPTTAQQKASPSGSPSVPVSSGQPSKGTRLGGDVELEILRERNRLLEEHNRELLQVTLWSIGFAAFFLVAVLGLVGFFTERRYQRDRTALEQGLDAQFVKATTELTTKQAEAANQLKGAMGTAAEEIVTTKLKPITNQLSALSYSLRWLEVENAEKQAEEWEQKGVLTNALRSYARCAKHAHAHGIADWKVPECLERISQLLDRGGRFNPSDVTEVTAFLKSLPSKYEPLATKIQKKLAS